MPITIRWDNEEKTTIYQRYEGSWTWDEYWAGVEQFKAMMGEVDHPIDILVDLSTFEIPSDFMLQLKWMDEALAQLLPQLRYAVLYDTPSLMQAILRIARTLYVKIARHVIVVRTSEDAYAFLNKHRNPKQTTNQS